MRVLQVIPTLDHVSGGPSMALTGFARALRKRSVDVRVAVGRGNPRDDVLAQRLREVGVTVVAGADLSLPEEIAACDVCHIHAVWERLLHQAAITSRRCGKPHLFRPCGMLDPWSLAHGRLKKRLYIALRLRRDLDRCTAMHFTTRIERDVVASLGFRAATIVEANGVSLEEFEDLPAPGTFRARHPAIGDRPLLVIVSRLHRIKGFDLLLPALARCGEPDARLAIVGPDEGGYRAVVESMIRAYGLGEQVVLTGALHGRDRVAALADADVFVLPSYHENFGVAVVEALAAGTPVIVSDQVNLKAEVAAAGVGAVVPLQVEALAGALATWLSDAERRGEAARRARAFVRERFGWDEIARRWADRYEVLARGELPADARPPS